jgi:hypothetical protein
MWMKSGLCLHPHKKRVPPEEKKIMNMVAGSIEYFCPDCGRNFVEASCTVDYTRKRPTNSATIPPKK